MAAPMAVGAYQTACEQSPNKNQIDTWMNEGKSSSWISKELKVRFAETISDKSISKYRKYREEFIQNELEKDPTYQGKMANINQDINTGIGKIREVDIMGKLSDAIEQCAEMLDMAKQDDIRIKSAQDLRFVSQTMLDAIKIYGDTVLKAQRFSAVDNDPSLLRPTTINISVKTALADLLKGSISGDGGYDVIDRLRNGINRTDVAPVHEDYVIDDTQEEDGDE